MGATTRTASAALGLFPVTAGSSQFQNGSPFFDSTTITYAGGTRFTVTADVSLSNYYVQDATLDGERFGNTWLDYSQMVTGGTLDFRMGAQPSQWGTRTQPAYSLDTDEGGGSGTPGHATTTVTAGPATVATTADDRPAARLGSRRAPQEPGGARRRGVARAARQLLRRFLGAVQLRPGARRLRCSRTPPPRTASLSATPTRSPRRRSRAPSR